MGNLSLSLLGTFEGLYEQRPLTHFRTKAVQALLIYLVCQPEVHSREALMVLLWPELPTKSAQGNLRHTLYHLRQLLPTVQSAAGEAVPFLLADRQMLQVNPDGRFHLDITQFEALAGSQEVVDWETAVALYRADFLNDFYWPNSIVFESWVQNRRLNLRRRLLDTLANLTDHNLDTANYEQAEQYARQQLALDNLRESAHRQLMELLARIGRRAAALTHYQTLRQLLQDELGITPSAATEALVATIRRDNLVRKRKQRESMVQEAAATLPPHNLPAQATPFIGRQTELEALGDLLTALQTRLITIVGAGGMGKTRLALAVAERQLTRQQFPHGIFFVPLASLGQSERIVSAVAEAMQIRLDKGETQLLNYLKAKKTLLVLDNFEHLLEGSSVVSRLLQTAPQLYILITSRERLRLQGEQIYPLQGLEVDDTAVTNEARTLFLQAARRLRPDFEVTAENLPVLNHICRLVEGMPLALELAAAWVDLYTLPDIAAEIQRNLDFLKSDLRDMVARHRSMQAVFDASWQQLSAKSQRLFAQLSVFQGGFTREAVTAVTNASVSDLAVLVNKSLLTFDAAHGRYIMHQLLWQYAATKQEANGRLQERHCDYYCQWVTHQLDSLYGQAYKTTVRQLRVDMENIRAAITHALRQERFTDLDAILPTLTEYFRVSGQRQEGITLYQPIYAALKDEPKKAPVTLFWVTQWLSEFHGVLDQILLFETYQQQAKEMLKSSFFQQRDSRVEQAIWLYQEGYRLLMREPDTAVQLFRQSHTLIAQVGNNAWQVPALIGLVRAARNAQDLDLARVTVAQTISLAQTVGNPIFEIEARLLMGNLAIAASHFAAAEELLSTSITHLQQINHPVLLGLGLMYLVMAQEFNGRFATALQTEYALQRVGEKLGNPLYQKGVYEAQILIHLGKYEQSAAMGQKALCVAQVNQENWTIYAGHRLLSMLALLNGDLSEARSQLQASEAFLLKGRPLANIFSNQVVWGLIAAIEGETAVAQQHIRQLMGVALAQQHTLKAAMTTAVAACLYATQNQPEKAIALYTLAQQDPYVANSRWFADVIGKRITAVSNKLAPAEIAAATVRGKAMDIWETARIISTAA